MVIKTACSSVPKQRLLVKSCDSQMLHSVFPSGLRAGDEVLAVNGATLSGLDLDLVQSVFSHRRLQLLLRRNQSLGPEDLATTANRSQPSDLCLPPAPLDLQAWTSSTTSVPSGPSHSVILLSCSFGR